jgi:hypothetical protein
MALFDLFRKLYPKQAIYLLSEAGFHARVVSVNVSINQVSSPHPTQSPTHAFMGFSLDFGSLKGEIYFGSGYLIFNLGLYLCFFKKWGMWNKDITKQMNKRIYYIGKRVLSCFGCF